MARPVALLDANVLYPARLRDLLLRLAIAGLYQARWSEEILDECFENLREDRPDLTAAQLSRTRRLMNTALPDATVTGHEPRIEDLELPDPDDRHVLAAAVTTGAALIVTANLADFPSDELPAGTVAVSPDQFVLGLADDDLETVLDVVETQATELRNPPMATAELLDGLEAVDRRTSASPGGSMGQLLAGARGRRAATMGTVRKLLVVVFVLGLLVATAGPAHGGDGEPAGAEPADVELVIFWGEGCPYCAAERDFLEDLAASRPGLVVRDHEVYGDEANRRLFEQMAADAGITPRSVPTTFLGDRVWVGFGDATAASIRDAVDDALAGRVPAEDPGGPGAPEVVDSVVDVPFVGPVDVGDRSLVVSTLLIGFVDGVNPCSLWVLSVLLALVLHGGSRRRVVAVGTVFLAVTSTMYGIYIAGLYSALRYVQYLTWIQRTVAVVVGVLGLLQLKDVVAFHRGPSLGVPERAKPGMYRRMRRLADPERSVPVVLGATALLAVGVSLLETPCTLGLPLLWTDLLARNDVSALGTALLLVVYLAVFLVDELVVFLVVVATMRAVRLQERHGRDLKLVSGVVMVALASVMLVRPTMLETVGGALAVFGLAAGLAAAGLLADRRLHRA